MSGRQGEYRSALHSPARGRGTRASEVEGLAAGYGAFLVLRDLGLEALPGLTVGPRAERRRQDDAAEGDRRPDPADRPGAARRRRDRRRRPDLGAGAPRHRPRRRGPPAVPADDGDGEPRARRLAGPAGRARRPPRARLRRLPAARRAPPPAGRDDERRRAADGGDGAGDDERPAPAAARRALARPGAEDGRRDARDRAPHRRHRHDRADGRAERAQGAGHRRPRLRARARPGGGRGRGGRAGALQPGPPGLPRPGVGHGGECADFARIRFLLERPGRTPISIGAGDLPRAMRERSERCTHPC